MERRALTSQDHTGRSQTPCDADAPTDAGGRPVAPDAVDFDGVYTQYFDFACRSLRLLGVAPHSLEDAAQDVFGVVSRRLGEYAGEASLKTWIFAIVQRVAANHRRTQRRKQWPLQPLVDEPATGADTNPEAHLEATRAAERIAAFCEDLDDGHRTVFVLALIEDVSPREVAAMLDIPLFTVYSRIRSLRERLERFLHENMRDT